MSLVEKIRSGVLIFDGGYGTMFNERGLAPGEFPEMWSLLHPEIVTDVHREYLEAGAEVLTVNTFGANRFKFTGTNGDYSVERVVGASADCAKRALDTCRNGYDGKYIALDIGPTGRMLKPLGDLGFEEAVDIFAQVVRAGVSAGVDMILIETMNDSYETKAALLAAKENSSLPVFVTNVYDESGRLMTGADASVMAAMLEGLGADAIGINCGFGPESMKNTVAQLLKYASVPVIVNPNAGLPSVHDGKVFYDVSAEEFASLMKEMILSGVRVAGGCCGTTPEYIKSLADSLRDIDFDKLNRSMSKSKIDTIVTSGSRSVDIGQETVLIGERINPTGKKKIKEALKEASYGYIIEEAVRQEEAGVHVLDVNAGLPEINEKEVLAKLVSELQSITALPLQIDTSDPDAMENALRIYNGKAIINSVNGKKESLERILPIAKKYGGVLIALTLDENGIPETACGRLEIARSICDAAAEYGIGKRDIIIDPLAMAVSADPESAQVTLESIRLIKKELCVKVSLGVSNVSFGLPEREILTSVFFAEALSCGLDAAIMNPFSERMMSAYYVHQALSGRDSNFSEYISYVSSKRISDSISSDLSEAAKDIGTSAEENENTLKSAVVKGLCEKSRDMAEMLLSKNISALDIINDEIIPALNEVGDGFERKKVYLPQLLMSAEAAKAAFTVVKKSMLESTVQGEKGEKIVLATVKGDIHDIGKNIVKALLENFGFEIIDLGRDVPPEVIVEEAKKNKVKLVGLSALMTTTVPAMEETILQLHREVPDCLTVVGGAVMTNEYASMIGADKYCKDAMETVRYAEKIFGRK